MRADGLPFCAADKGKAAAITALEVVLEVARLTGDGPALSHFLALISLLMGRVG